MTVLFSTCAAPLGIAAATEAEVAAVATATAEAGVVADGGTAATGAEDAPGVSGPEAEPPPSGSTFSFPFSGLSGSLVLRAINRSLFFLVLSNSANKLVELMLFSWARAPVAGVVRRGEAGRGRGGVVGDRLGRRRTGVRLPLLRFFPLKRIVSQVLHTILNQLTLQQQVYTYKITETCTLKNPHNKL